MTARRNDDRFLRIESRCRREAVPTVAVSTTGTRNRRRPFLKECRLRDTRNARGFPPSKFDSHLRSVDNIVLSRIKKRVDVARLPTFLRVIGEVGPASSSILKHRSPARSGPPPRVGPSWRRTRKLCRAGPQCCAGATPRGGPRRQSHQRRRRPPKAFGGTGRSCSRHPKSQCPLGEPAVERRSRAWEAPRRR
jgi:hypothetical protein